MFFKFLIPNKIKPDTLYAFSNSTRELWTLWMGKMTQHDGVKWLDQSITNYKRISLSRDKLSKPWAIFQLKSIIFMIQFKVWCIIGRQYTYAGWKKIMCPLSGETFNNKHTIKHAQNYLTLTHFENECDVLTCLYNCTPAFPLHHFFLLTRPTDVFQPC